MKRGAALLLIGGLGVGAFLAYKYRGKLAGLVSPDPTVTSIARSQFGTSLDVPGTIAGTTGVAARPGSTPIATALGIVGDVLSGQGSSGSASYGADTSSSQSSGLAPAGIAPLPTDVIDQYLTGDVMA